MKATHTTRNRVIAAAALVVAGGVGFAAGSPAASSSTSSATPTPAAVTVTAPAPAPVVKTVTPQACLAALGDAESVITIEADQIQLGQPLAQMVSDAAQAGMSYDSTAIADITARMGTITTRTNANTDKITALTDTIGADFAACRASAN